MTTHDNYDAYVRAHGRVTIPQEVRSLLGLSEGDKVSFLVEQDGTVKLVTAAQIARQLYGIYAHLSNGHVVDDFIAERHRDAEAE